jgi:hypothetical protein
MRRFSVDCTKVSSFAEFIEAINVGFIRPAGGEWNGNLDAFHDYLSWPNDETYELELLGQQNCSTVLGHEAQADWLRAHLSTCHPDNVPDLRKCLEAAERHEGDTLFEVLCGIVADNSHVTLLFT